ncbi:MAG: hypothetical protein AB1540_14105 [Bdellovibrionota bacterium]
MKRILKLLSWLPLVAVIILAGFSLYKNLKYEQDRERDIEMLRQAALQAIEQKAPEVCRADVRRFCANESLMALLHCLDTHRSKFTPECAKAIEAMLKADETR